MAAAPKARPIQYLIVDTSGIIEGGDFWQKADHLISVSEVLDEVRDKKTLTFLRDLPVKVDTHTPDKDSVLAVIKAARLLGDYGYLSKTDIKLLALAHHYARLHDPNFKDRVLPEEDPEVSAEPQAEAEATPGGPSAPRGVWGKPVQEALSFADVLRQKASVGVKTTPVVVRAPVERKGARAPKKTINPLGPTTGVEETPDVSALSIDDAAESYGDNDELDDVLTPIDPCQALQDAADRRSKPADRRERAQTEDSEGKDEEGNKPDEEDEEEEEWEEEEEDEDDEWGEGGGSDGEGDWITPLNIGDVKSRDTALVDSGLRPVALLTTDFPMQNVAMFLGIHLLAKDGRTIAYLKHWILRCHGCFTLVTDTTRQFCPQCGSGDTLKKVSYTRKPDGDIEVWINWKKEIRVRGNLKKLPRPKGGKHGTNKTVVVREDQLRNCGRVYNRERDDRKVAALMHEDWNFGPRQERKRITHLAPTESFFKTHRRR